MKKIRTHYDNLKVSRDAPDEVISAAYKSLAKKYHPDRNHGSKDAVRIMAIINESYEILRDPSKRKEHDQWIADQETSQHEDRKSTVPPPSSKDIPHVPNRQNKVIGSSLAPEV